jgi:hypothetical protein
MNTNFKYHSKFLSVIFQVKNIVFVVILFFLNEHLVAQIQEEKDVAPFSYTPPDGNSRWSGLDLKPDCGLTGCWFSVPVISASFITVDMDNLSKLNDNEDGLLIAFNISLGLKSEGKPIIAFNDSVYGYNFLEFEYSKQTVTARRYNTINGKRISYEYHLFDQLFEGNVSDSATWRMGFYITSCFTFIYACKDGTQNIYLSPLYFGMDHQKKYPDPESKMYKFIKRDHRATIIIGDVYVDWSPYISRATIRSFVYADWWKQVQREFSSPNPPKGE